ncbi:MAG TPA: nuclear transport factor 2 family protein [Acidimicrobiales bacterium]|nr:nuclear transport factor 2 family protein [Acidimicrobiales bacterium]
MSDVQQADRGDDRAAVVDLLHGYAHAVDDADAAAVVACFTPAGRFSTRDGSVDVRGPAQLMAYFGHVFAGPMAPPGVVTTHLMGNVVVAVDPGGISATTLLDAVVYRWSAGGGTVTARGLRYRDRVERTAAGWLLAEREHDLRWQGEMPAAPAFAIGD